MERNLLCVGKTKYIYNPIDKWGCYFFSRPRCFGKSTLLGAISDLFQGNRDPFPGLWIGSSDYDFKKRPVLRLNMALPSQSSMALRKSLVNSLKWAADSNGQKIGGDIPSNILEALVRNIADRSGEKVAVLIDEYAAPILSQLGNVPST
jgi:hypothetical protein